MFKTLLCNYELPNDIIKISKIEQPNPTTTTTTNIASSSSSPSLNNLNIKPDFIFNDMFAIKEKTCITITQQQKTLQHYLDTSSLHAYAFPFLYKFFTYITSYFNAQLFPHKPSINVPPTIEVKDIKPNYNGQHLVLLTTIGLAFYSNQSKHCLIYEPQLPFNDNTITSIAFSPIHESLLIFSTRHSAFIYDFGKDIFKSSKYIYEKILNNVTSVNSNNTIIKSLYSPNGDYIIIVSTHSLFIYNSITYELIYSKTFLNKTWEDCAVARSSSLIVLHTSTEVFIVNAYTFDYKSYSFMEGVVRSVVVEPCNENIYVFITNNDVLLMYTLHDVEKGDYYNLTRDSVGYNCSTLSYVHKKYEMFHKIYEVLRLDEERVMKVEIGARGNVLCIMYNDKLSGKNVVAVYDVVVGSNSYQNNMKVKRTYMEYEGENVEGFEVVWDGNAKKDVLVCNFGNKYMLRFDI